MSTKSKRSSCCPAESEYEAFRQLQCIYGTDLINWTHTNNTTVTTTNNKKNKQ